MSSELGQLFPEYYVRAYPDLWNSIGPGNPQAALKHYLQMGISEGRSPNPFFLPAFYLEVNPDVRAACGEGNFKGALEHWLSHGYLEGRRGSSVFYLDHYLHAHTDLAEAFGARAFLEAFKHWRWIGCVEGRRTSPDGPPLVVDFGDTLSPDAIHLLQSRGPDLPAFRLGMDLLAESLPIP